MSIAGIALMAVLGAGCAAHLVYFIMAMIRMAKAERARARAAPPVMAERLPADL